MKRILIAAMTLLAGSGTAMAGKADSCKDASYFVDAKTKWTYFTDVVVEVVDVDGATKVAFQKRSKMFELPASADATFRDALNASLTNKSKIHIAVDAAGGMAVPKPGGVSSSANLDRIQWASADKQHDTCR